MSKTAYYMSGISTIENKSTLLQRKYQAMQTPGGHIVRINEGNKLTMHEVKKPNVVFYSELKEWQATDAFQNFSVKYVIHGLINYRMNNTLHSVKSNQVLIGNKQPGVRSYFESRDFVKSLCINIDMDVIAQAQALLSAKNDPDPDKFLYNLHPPFFAERIFTMDYEEFLSPLKYLAKVLEMDKQSPLVPVNEEFFLYFSEKITTRLFEDCKIYQDLNCIRINTKTEIVRRLDIAKNYLLENYLLRPTVKDLSVVCNMSEFHFFRAFRQVYKITPYQFQLTLRLEKAKQLITYSSFSFLEIAERCAFTDLSTFSKAFKRMYNISPSGVRGTISQNKPFLTATVNQRMSKNV